MRTIATLSLHDDAVHTTRGSRVALIRQAVVVNAFASSVLYIATTLIGARQWPDYNWLSQTISELSAIDAPSRPTVVLFMTAYSMLAIMVGIGVHASATHRASRTVGLMLGLYGAVCLFAPLTPMHLRATQVTLTDVLHIALTIFTAALIVIAVAAGAFAFGRRFRAYSLGTLIIFLVFGTLTGIQGQAIAADQPTPFAGLLERISIFSFMLWVVVYAMVAARQKSVRPVVHNSARADRIGP